ncbi:MAG: hypothetical protein ILNGONEN_02522 [Syntrophorhabdaceae bacterium]|nr:hypothetical protein [Syntrophorhabdaceae bacterium]
MNTMAKSRVFFAIVLMLMVAVTFLSLSTKLFAQTTKTLTSQSDAIRTMTFSKSGKYFVVGGSSKLVEVWDLTNNERIKEMKGHKEVIRSVAFSPKEDIVASTDVSAKLIVWELSSGRPLHTISAGPFITTLDLNEDGTLIEVGGADKIQLFSVDAGTKTAEIKTPKAWNNSRFHKENVVSLLIPYEIRDKQISFKRNNYTLKTFNSITGNELNSFATPDFWEMRVKLFELHDVNISAIPPQTNILDSDKADDANLFFILKPNNIIEIWDSAEGIKLGTLQKGFSILRIAVEPSGRYIATSGENNLISLWDLASMPEVASRMVTK